MAKSRVKGILVEIGGDTSGLQKALSKVNGNISSLSKELKDVNSLLKLDPKNTELANQKQKLLNDSIKETSSKLEELKEAQRLADEQIANGTEISDENYRALQREILETENKLKSLKAEASNWTKAGRSIEEFGNKVTNISSKIDKLGTTLTTRLTLPITAVGTYAVNSFKEVDEGADIVIKKTGAVGDSAEALKDVYKRVSSSVVGDFGDVGSAVGEINTRFGFTGEALEEASEKFLKFAKINDTDVNTAVQKVSRYMGDASIEASKYGEVLDQLSSVAQASGISIDSLSEMLTKYGALMRALGLNTKESIAIFAGWEKAGVNTEIAFSGMKKAIGTWGKEGKNATKEFKKTLEQIKKCPDIASATTKAIAVFGQKAGPDLADAIKGGRFEYSEFLDILEKSEGTLENTYNGIIDETDEVQMSMKKLKVQFSEVGKEALKTLVPTLEKILDGVSGLISSYNKLDDKQKKQINNMIVFAAAIGPATKLLGTLGKTVGTSIKTVGNFTQAIGLIGKTSTDSFKKASTETQSYAKILTALTSPPGLILTAIGIMVTGIILAMENAEKETKEAFSNMESGATDFITGIEKAKSHLDSFNSTLFASSEEQQKLKDQMDEVQKGITNICKTASDERRGYTQEEIKQLDEYFQKLRELNQREIEIQQSIAGAISQQAITNAQNFQGSLEEYKQQSQEWIKTAEEQKSKTIELINSQSIEEVALLNQRYGEEANMQNENYANEYNKIIAQKEEKIAQAQDEVAKINLAYSNGYLERTKQNEGFLSVMNSYNTKAEEENNRHNQKVQDIENGNFNWVMGKTKERQSEAVKYNENMKKIWEDMYKNMSSEQEKEMGTWLAMVAQTEMYGGEIDEETIKIVDNILESYDSMPPKTQEAMKNAMTPMLTEMENKEPSLYAKANGIAEGILSRLKKSFEIHSPSKKTRKIFNYAMEGAELGLEDREEDIYKEIDRISNQAIQRFNKINGKINIPKIDDFGKLQGKLSNKIIDSTKTVYTTPQIVFNVQELDEAKLQQCFDYINRKFGSSY